MTDQYIRFNEKTFEAYCKVAVDKAVLKEKAKKMGRAVWEWSLSEMTDATLFAVAKNDEYEEAEESEPRIFIVQGRAINVYHDQLGQALSFLLPRDREIILLYYFADLNDEEIAKRLKLNRATVQRRRNQTKQKMKLFLEGIK